MDPASIQKLIGDYEKECEEIRRNALSLSWYMRGAVSYVDVLNMSRAERQLINQLAEKNLETTKKTQLPFF